MRPPDLAAHLRAQGVEVSDSDARRALAHLVAEGHADLSSHRHLRRTLREAVETLTERTLPEVLEEVRDGDDGSVRSVLRFADGTVAETVRIPLLKPGTWTVCLSSQVGCAMRCAFCATGRLGLTRNLEAGEIVGSFLVARRQARAEGGTLRGAVFMGQGEPLHNYEEVIRAAQVLSDPCAGRIDARAISISTVGLVPQIRRFTAEGHRFRLIVSLTSAIGARRAELVPVAGRVPLEDLAEALREHQAATGERQTVAWVLLGGVNDGAEEVDALQTLLGDVPLRVNLIDVNDARPDGFRRSTDVERNAFFDALQVLRAPVVRRYSVGRGEHSACGMLAARHTPAFPPL
jgi:23S rRNA (adenine2503-C2)-methyltransferase